MGYLSRSIVLFLLLGVLAPTGEVFAQVGWRQSSGPEGGNVRSVAASTDGATVVAGLWNGKLYRTKAGDQAWTALEPVYGLQDLSAEGNIVFAQTYDGMFLSYDFGTSWIPVVKGSNSTQFSPIVRAKDGLYFIANDSIYRSSDAGDSWTYTGSTGQGATMLGYSGDKDGGRLIAASGFNGVFASSDKGATWIRAENELPATMISSMVTVYDAKRLEYQVWTCVTDQGIYYTDDGGDRWRKECDGLPSYSSGYPNFTKLVEANGHLYGFSARSVFEYDDNTEQWMKAEHLVGKNIQAYGGKLYSSSADGVEISQDGGMTWQPVGKDFRYTTVSEFTSARNAVLAAAQNGIFRTLDNGVTWTKTGDFYSEDIAAGHGIAYAESLDGVRRSTDDGLTWELSNNGISEELSYLSTVAANGSAAFAGFYNVSGEHGVSNWSSGGIFRSTDAGATWQAASSGLSAKGGVRVPINKLQAYDDVQFALAIDGLYRSTNNGDSWSKASIAIDLQNDMLVDVARRHDTIIVASMRSMFRSIDAGSTWQTFNSGLQSTLENQQALLMLEDTLILESYNMLGQLRTYRLEGNAWVSFMMSAPPGVEFTDFFANGTTLYAGSNERSVWTRTIPLQASVKTDITKAIGLTVYPNPISAAATVSFSLPKSSSVHAGLYDVTGVLVMELESGLMAQGQNTLQFSTSALQTLSAGTYLCRIMTDEGVAQEQVVLLK